MKRRRPRRPTREFAYRGRSGEPANSLSSLADFLVIEADANYVKLPDYEKRRLAQASGLLRLYEHGRLPVELMRALDAVLT
jgi:hypothetical protein